MAEIFDFHVQDDRSILIPQNRHLEPIMQEDKDVATWRFRIPKVLNQIDMSAWSWWFVYVNAKGQTFSELLTLTNDIDEPSSYSTADYDIDYGISKFPGSFSFALEAISAQQGGEIDGEWHTKTYKHKVDSTLQGNQAEYAETESDIISALMQEVRNKVNQLVGGATPLPVNLKSLMTDHDKVYLYTGSETGESTGYWYHWNGTDFVPGGLYGAGVQIDPTLSQSGQAADALETGRRFERVYSYEGGGSSAGSGNVWVEYSVKAGHTYMFTNTSSVAISPNTVRAINTYDYIEQLGIIQAGKTLTFTAIADAPALMVYSGGASTWTIAEQTTIFNLYEKTSNIGSINNDIVALKYSAGKIGQIISAIDASEQYLNNTAWEEGYFNWSSGSTPINKVSAVSPWYRQEIKDLPSGTYYFNAFCSPGFTFFVDKVTGTAYRASDLGVTQGVSGSLTFENAFDAYIAIYDSATMSKDVAMFASGKLPASYVYGLYKINGLYTNAQGQTIYIVGEGYIPTIQGACDLAADNDIIFIRCGTYEEQVSIWTRKLHLIGEDKLNTVLVDHSGYYGTPPLEMAKGSLSNLTIIEDGTEPFSDSSDSKYMMAYCLHIEHPSATGETFEIDNCNFINEIHVPLGCGLRGNNTVRFRNCRFYCGATDETVSQERGAFFVHSENAKNVENQWVIAENCIMESKGPRLAAMFGVPSGAQNTGSMYIRLSNCTLWNDNRGVADSTVTFDTGGGADVMKLSHSYGNSISALNGND